MNLESFKHGIKTKYKSLSSNDINTKISDTLSSLETDWETNPSTLSFQELKVMATAMLEEETRSLHDTISDLLAEKERIDRQIARRSEELQNLKYHFFNALENAASDNQQLIEMIHQVKIQSIDLLDILEEMVESAIITTLEKGSNIEETLHEIIKEITFQTLNANVLNAVRIRRIFASILQSALNVSEAMPTKAETIYKGTLLGIRSALHKSIEKFHQYLLFIPDEVKALYREEYKTIEAELANIDTLMDQVLHGLESHNSPELMKALRKVSHEIRFDTDEIQFLSRQTAELLRKRLERITNAVASSKIMQSKSAQEAKAMGVRAWSVAKSAMEGAIKGAKDAMDKK